MGLVMTETPGPEGSEELFELLDQLPKRISGFVLDGGKFSFDKTNQNWVVQQKIHGHLVKLNVPSGLNDVVKRLKELMVNIKATDLEHMETMRKKVRDVRQPIMAEEISQSAWSVRVSFLLGQALHMKAMQHIDLSAEERKDPDLATEKFLAYYEGLLKTDITRLTPDEIKKRDVMRNKAEQAAKQAGYKILDRTMIPYLLIRYSCPNMPQAPIKLRGSETASVMIQKSLWNDKVEQETIKRDIGQRMSALY